jgi:DNA-directed RNA polymerase subunit RPC12/RpoP
MSELMVKEADTGYRCMTCFWVIDGDEPGAPRECRECAQPVLENARAANGDEGHD